MANTYFNTKFKGYDKAQVDAFIVELSDKYSKREKELEESVHSLKSENELLKSDIAKLRAEAEQTAQDNEIALAEQRRNYDEMCAKAGESFLNADMRASEITNSAARDAESMKAAAKAEAEKEASRIIENARRDAARIIEDTERRCSELNKAADEFRKRQSEMERSMSETEKSFGDALNKLREDINEQ